MISTKKSILYFAFLMFALQLTAQKKPNILTKYNVIAANFTYAAHRPGGDLADRFGNSLEIGIGADYITKKSRFIFGLTGTVEFGSVVHENVLAIITNEDGNLVGNDQIAGVVGLRQRGIYVGAHVGKIFKVASNSLSGIRVTVGSGILQHRIRIQDDLENINIIAGDNVKGFDRLSNGLAFHQFLGYQHFGKSGLFNVFGGVEAYEGFTMSRRSFDNTLMRRDDTARVDILLGLKIGLSIKFNLNETGDEIYY